MTWRAARPGRGAAAQVPGAAFTPHQIGKVLERSADHGKAMIAGPIAPVIPASALAAVG
ncbi:MAG TPA: hypothetical protein VNO25_19085 [Streptosporangiaceae bacterium]|nr:hypothetical protein [Streptosporangiaceae bacterium]